MGRGGYPPEFRREVLDLNDDELARLREAAGGIRAKCTDLASV